MPIKWSEECLRLSRLDCKSNPEHMEAVARYVVEELTKKVISKRELYDITSEREIRHFVRESVLRFDPERHLNVGWYTFQRVKFLVIKWRRLRKQN